jgi:hypothetical protein
VVIETHLIQRPPEPRSSGAWPDMFVLVTGFLFGPKRPCYRAMSRLTEW